MAARFALSATTLVTGTGKPLAGAKINFFANNTTNDQDTFPTVALSGANVNPLICDADGRVPEAWADDTDLFSIQVLDANDNVIIPTFNDVSFISPFTLSSADVLAALDSNAAAVVINGSQMSGSAYGAFADDLTLTAAGTIDTTAGTTTLGATTIAGGLTVGTGDATLSAGVMSLPAQPCFQARSAGTANVTGNGTVYTVVWGTETFDQASNFSSTTFTAPVTGRYLLTVFVQVNGATAAADTIQVGLLTSNRNYFSGDTNTNSLGSEINVAFSIVVDMDASDTAHVTVTGVGEASNVMDISLESTFSGCLLA